jgi:hypothetical protein
MGNDPELKEFKTFIKDISYRYFNMNKVMIYLDINLYFKDLWVQEFPKAGGGETLATYS